MTDLQPHPVLRARTAPATKARIEPGRAGRLLRRADVVASTKLTWVWLVHAYKPEIGVEFRINVAEMAGALALSPRTIRRALQTLHNAGQLNWRHGHIGGWLTYPENLGTVTICHEPPAHDEAAP